MDGVDPAGGAAPVTIVVTVDLCVLPGAGAPVLRVAAHPGNNPMSMPGTSIFTQNNPTFPITLTLSVPKADTYAVDAFLDFPPYVNPPNPPDANDPKRVLLGVVVTSGAGAKVSLGLK